MATTITNLGIVEAAQKALLDRKYIGYVPNVSTQWATGKRKGDTTKVQLITAASAADFNAATQNYTTPGGSIVNKDVTLDKHKVVTLELPQVISDRAQVQRVVDAAIRNIAIAAAADVFGLYVAATYTNTAQVIGTSANFTHKKFVALKDNIVTYSLDPENTTVAIGTAYATAVEGDSNVANALAISGRLIGGSAFYPKVSGLQIVRTAAVPTGTNVVGVQFDAASSALAFGTCAPWADDNTVAYQEVVDPETGFTIGIREVHNVATGSKFITAEACYGVAAGNITKAVLLTSA